MNQTLFRQGYDITNPDYLDTNRMGKIHPDQKALFTHPAAGLIGLLQPGRHSGLKLFIVIPFLLVFGAFALFAFEIPSGTIFLLGFLVFVLLGVLIAYAVYRFFRRNNTRKTEIEQGVIRHAAGEVTFSKRGYQIKLHDRFLQLPFSGLGDLSPGIEYRFYYLPKSNTVLSAEQLTSMGSQRAKESLTEILARVNRFQLNALPQNRQGILATEQIIRLLPGLLIATLFIVLPFGFTAYSLRPYLREQNWSNIPTAAIIMGGVLGVVGLVALYLLFKSVLDIINGRVLSIEGQAQRYTRTSSDSDGGSSTNYYYQIGEQRFKVTRKAYHALIEGLTYRAYYTPYRKTLVNIEALESPLDEG